VPALEQQVGVIGEVRLASQHAIFLGIHGVILTGSAVSSAAVRIIQHT
jgi:hypothetical protein